MTAKKRQIAGGMKVRAYTVLERAVEEGVAIGWRRAHKHTDEPAEEHVKGEILTAVLNEVSEYFAFDEEGGA